MDGLAAFPPHAVMGDGDSITAATAEACAAAGCAVRIVDDQDTTDCEKCLRYVHAKQEESGQVG